MVERSKMKKILYIFSIVTAIFLSCKATSSSEKTFPDYKYRAYIEERLEELRNNKGEKGIPILIDTLNKIINKKNSTKHLSSEEIYLGREAIKMLGKVKIENPKNKILVINKLLEISEKMSWFQSDAAQTLIVFGEKAVPGIIKILQKESFDGLDGRSEVLIDVLGEIGPDAKKALPLLRKLFQETYNKDNPFFHNYWSYLRWEIVNAIGKIGAKTDDSIAILKSIIEKEEVKEGYLEMVIPQAQNWDILTIYEASKSLVAIAPTIEHKQKANSALIKLFQYTISNDVRFNKDLIKVIKEMNIEALYIFPDILENLKNGDKNVKIWTLKCLNEFKQDLLTSIDVKEINQLRPYLKSESRFVRGLMARFIGKLGKKSKSVVPDLVQLINDKDEFVRIEAAKAMKRIENDNKKP